MENLKEKILQRLETVDRPGMEHLIDYLENKSDYFIAPASTKFHSNYDMGLAIHSDKVVEQLLKKNDEFALKMSLDTIYLTGYLHDLCKCNVYTKGMGIKKDDLNNKWIGVDKYEYLDNVPLGHGEKSVILIQQFIHLTLEECLMIRWHMGAYLPKEEMRDFERAKELYKSVLAMCIADEEASRFLEEVREPETHDVEKYNEYMRQKALKK